jgi:hypothetical protein
MKIIRLAVFSIFIASLSANALPPPEKDEMSITDLEQQLFNLDGKVVETEFTYVSSFEQVAPRQYRAYCGYYKGTSSILSGESILIPEEGKELFEEMAEKDMFNSSSETVYLMVHSKSPVRVEGGRTRWSFELEAVGTRFKKSKGVYSW